MAATALVEKAMGTARLYVPEGEVPRIQLVPDRRDCSDLANSLDSLRKSMPGSRVPELEDHLG